MYITITDIGLVFDMIGVVLVYRYEILKTPPPINKGARGASPTEDAEPQLRRDNQLNPDYTKHKWLSRCGISLLVSGFALQIVSIRFPAPLCTISCCG